MELSRYSLAIAVSGAFTVLVASMLIWLLLAEPVALATAVNDHDLTSLAQAVATRWPRRSRFSCDICELGAGLKACATGGGAEAPPYVQPQKPRPTNAIIPGGDPLLELVPIAAAERQPRARAQDDGCSRRCPAAAP